MTITIEQLWFRCLSQCAISNGVSNISATAKITGWCISQYSLLEFEKTASSICQLEANSCQCKKNAVNRKRWQGKKNNDRGSKRREMTIATKTSYHYHYTHARESRLAFQTYSFLRGTCPTCTSLFLSACRPMAWTMNRGSTMTLTNDCSARKKSGNKGEGEKHAQSIRGRYNFQKSKRTHGAMAKTCETRPCPWRQIGPRQTIRCRQSLRACSHCIIVAAGALVDFCDDPFNNQVLTFSKSHFFFFCLSCSISLSFSFPLASVHRMSAIKKNFAFISPRWHAHCASIIRRHPRPPSTLPPLSSR